MSGNESPPKRELPWTDVEVAKLRRTFPTLSASALGRKETLTVTLYWRQEPCVKQPAATPRRVG